MLPLIIGVSGAAVAVASAVTTYAANEKDRQATKRYEKVNAELIKSRDKLQKQYYELSDRSKKQINNLNRKLAESEMEKDLVYLALSLYHELMTLREDIDINPSFEVLVQFYKAIILTNYVLRKLDKHLVPISKDYFRRNLEHIDQRDNLSKDQLLSFMAELMNPEEDTVTFLLDDFQNEIFQHIIFNSEDLPEEKQKVIELKESVSVDSIKDLVKQGEKYMEEELYEQALICFDKVLALDPDHDESLHYKSLIYYYCNHNEHSLTFANRAIDINPSKGEYYYQKSLCLCELGLRNEALKCLNRAIHLEPTEDIYLSEKSNLFCSFDEYEQALNFLDRALALNPQEFLYLSNRGSILYYLNQYDEALESLDKAIEINPDYDYAWYWRGLVLFEMKVLLFIDRKEEALESFKKAINLDPNNGEYWYWKSRCLLDLFKEKKALQSLKKAIALEPDNDEYRKLRDDINLSM